MSVLVLFVTLRPSSPYCYSVIKIECVEDRHSNVTDSFVQVCVKDQGQTHTNTHTHIPLLHSLHPRPHCSVVERESHGPKVNIFNNHNALK